MRNVILLSFFLIGCINPEPRIVNAYRIYNDTKDTIEVVEFILRKDITDSVIFNYSQPYKVFKNGAKVKKERVFINPLSSIPIELTSNWKEICKNNIIGVLILDKDSIKSIQSYKKGLINSCVLQFIQFGLDSLEKNNYEVHYYKQN